MRLVVKQDQNTVKEFQFAAGPIRIGRQLDNQIILADRAVSKQHAMLFNAEDGKWMVEDRNSANKTYLNDEVLIEKAEVKTGDVLRIATFAIEIDLEDESPIEAPVRPEDTQPLEAALATPPHDIVVRRPDASHAPAMRLAAKRLSDFSRATEAICGAKALDDLLLTLLGITLEQFEAYHVWCALREQATGPMTSHAGKRRDGRPIELSDIPLSDKITQAVEKGQFIVLPRVAAQIEEADRIRSAMIAAILRPTGCFGVLYVDNAMAQDHYSLSDLDYLMLVAMHTAAVLKNIIQL